MEELREASLELVIELAEPTSHDTVLDYAAGAGMGGFAIAPDVNAVEAADEQPDMLDEGRRLAAELGLVNVAFTLVDLYALPYKDGQFSLGICRNGFHLLPEPVAALHELLRVISPGGRLVVVDAVVDGVTEKPFNEIARLREPAHRRNYRPEQLEQLFKEAGLRIVRHSTVRRTVDLDYWLQAAAVPMAKAGLIRARFKNLSIEAQAAMDVVFADRQVSFSYGIAGYRLERA